MLGIAYEAKELNSEELRPFVFFNGTGEKVKLFPGSVLYYKLKD